MGRKRNNQNKAFFFRLVRFKRTMGVVGIIYAVLPFLNAAQAASYSASFRNTDAAVLATQRDALKVF